MFNEEEKEEYTVSLLISMHFTCDHLALLTSGFKQLLAFEDDASGF